ncbi:DUF72 domain-containing protein [Paucibacter sp. R3-3]|uniref:DUF72 domain-containing protein n=1 Tax=Roseateles agri TaxID=3098619 RepID=A0ABU5DQM1_9BURK|nr:DUF72 domain-containing protein [Paucibacter sp. R3-3]MDY0747569.1 DUF72 domain-containing protein [Paucibacter sp. R3-3]
MQLRIGTAGWSIPRSEAAAFPGEGQHLERFARVLHGVEIDTSFYRNHRREVYERWAAMTPQSFRFAVKLPRSITHDGRLRRARQPLRRFLAEVEGLGQRLGVLLVQLPPSLAYEARPVRSFFGLMEEEGVARGRVVVEPRHASWFEPAAERALAALRVSRAGADPARCEAAVRPGGWLGDHGDGDGAQIYYRWHGSPRMYWSAYEPAWLAERAHEIRQQWSRAKEVWCIFDNTAGGRALGNALAFRASA